MSTSLAGNRQQQLEANVNPRLHPSDHSDIAQIENKTYDPERDQRDMRRLGKRQELKVRSCMCKNSRQLH